MALAFLRIGGRSLPVVLGNFLKFSVSPKMFIWGKVEAPIKFFKKEKIKKEEAEEEPKAPPREDVYREPIG